MLDRLRPDRAESSACRCEAEFDGDRLRIVADDCPGEGDLAVSPDCLATAIEALRDRDADVVVTRAAGVERRYEGRAAALLLAAGRFAERAAFHDERLAERAARDPLAAAAEAAGRTGPVADAAVETGFAAVAGAASDYEDALRAYVGPPLAHSRVAPAPPPDGRLVESRELPTSATVRIYEQPDAALRTYHLEPVEATLSRDALGTLADAHRLLAEGGVEGGARAPGRAVRRVASADDPVATLTDVLAKHTRGFGVLADCFADDLVSDVFAPAPAGDRPLRVQVDGETMRTNVRLTDDGAAALASRLRRASGRAFSRASPTLDAVVTLGDSRGDGDREQDAHRTVRAAAVTEPATTGEGFAFRAHDREAWTLPALVAAGSLPADAAALCSLAVERGAAGLLAGTRGAGKTTLLSALCWELPASDRLVVVEDTPELPVAALQAHGRDVQPLRTSLDDGERGLSPTAALRAALRLGEGALVLGEVRGEEARVLYEAMRVGASGSAVLGTVHGDGGPAVRERVVSDLGVPESSFGATDLVVTSTREETPDGGVRRYVGAIEEVVGDGFETLYETAEDGDLAATGRVDRGNSHLIASLARPDESYADVREALADREAFLRDLVERGSTSAGAVVAAHARDRSGSGVASGTPDESTPDRRSAD